MTKELYGGQGMYEYLLECLRCFNKSHYCQAIEESLVVDETIYKMGFKKCPTYTVEVEMSQEDIDEMMDIIDGFYKTNFPKFDYYLEFYNFLAEIKDEQF